ncbi:hypothetical protein KQX54_013883 [Cotesia glomerata]|uniref:Uncharacterized protein n=1 Tax=Cotesia glomerata TaxID=32391 RepID=A0AAV7IKZ9_COTGL|nr:hypothetical protein KQX54_013883 [Cotesia glomerata]
MSFVTSHYRMSKKSKQNFKDSTVFVDFNCYVDRYETLCLKECYIVSLSLSLNGTPVDKHFVYEESDNYLQWPKKIQVLAAEHYNKYGIPLDRGSYSKHLQRKSLRAYLKIAKLIFVETTEKKKQLKRLIGNDLKIKSLSNRGYQRTEGQLICEWHDNPKTNQCAKGLGISILLVMWKSLMFFFDSPGLCIVSTSGLLKLAPFDKNDILGVVVVPLGVCV